MRVLDAMEELGIPITEKLTVVGINKVRLG